MEPNTVTQVKRIIRRWPAYRKYVENTAGDLINIKSLSQLPITDKEFMAQAIHSIPLCKVRNIVPSSGSTGGDFSFGLFGTTEMRKSSGALNAFLRSRLQTDRKKTLVLNLLPGAISFHAPSVSVASIGIRIDTAISAIRSLSSSYEQIVLAGEPLFIKALIEAGCREGIVWQYLSLFVFAGGEWIPESYRNYLESMVGPQRVFSSLGMAELGLNHFYETAETTTLRHLLDQDRTLLTALCGDVPFCPMLFAFDDRALVIETFREDEECFDTILLTTVDGDRVLPLIRFRSGDKGTRIDRDVLNEALQSSGYRPFDINGAPILVHFGRGRHLGGIFPETVKERLFADHSIAAAVTGNFRILKKDRGIVLHIQLSPRWTPDDVLSERLERVFAGLNVEPVLHVHETYPWPLNFERKVSYVAQD